jgi:hypothetical protein
MKYLKAFENWDILIPEDEQYNGLTKDFIDDMFIDISDDYGFKIITHFDKRAITKVDKEEGKMIINTIPYIWVRFTNDISDDTSSKDRLDNYKRSKEFKDIIETANDRLHDFGWYISEPMVLGNQIRIFIHRIEDKKYVH